MADSNSETGQPAAARAALLGLCPDCGAPTLFEGPLQFAPRCRVCGLDYSQFNVGDGPAALVTLVVGALIVMLALGVDALLRPPLWVHLLLWVPFTAAAVVGSLRATKGALLVLEHRQQAREGRLDPPDRRL